MGAADEAFVLKRIRMGADVRSEAVHLSGLREAYFGGLLCNQSATVQAAMHPHGCQHIVRFVESFQVLPSVRCLSAETNGMHLIIAKLFMLLTGAMPAAYCM